MEIKYNRTLPIDYAKLMLRCNAAKHDAAVITGALRDSLFNVGLYDDGELIAFGRIVGDGHTYFLLCDILVDPDYTELGYEYMIMKELNDYILEYADSTSRIFVIAETPLDEQYLKLGYKYLDPDFEVIMTK